ncbi:hypothetical protein [Agrococcus sp. SGAir0287]|uniref:hypothetical protein n=1 Tax=Agrococcus sp. SGAir0287 TaxID=2070347 RepID=UPI0010CD299E|nr:hypothetical protein [Agrococcus sp. SGAir0287]QCR18120.1 hypothetical protein C1N71_00550 [Agrococcus sp. SGAir0287]
MTRTTSTRRRRVPIRLIAAAVGAVLVAGNALLVLGPVMGLVGAAASVGPVFQVPVGAIGVSIAVGFLVAIACVVLAGIARRPALSWALVVAAWISSLVGSVWPIVVTANAAVDRVGDVVPYIVQLIGQLG